MLLPSALLLRCLSAMNHLAAAVLSSRHSPAPSPSPYQVAALGTEEIGRRLADAGLSGLVDHVVAAVQALEREGA